MSPSGFVRGTGGRRLRLCDLDLAVQGGKVCIQYQHPERREWSTRFLDGKSMLLAVTQFPADGHMPYCCHDDFLRQKVLVELDIPAGGFWYEKL